MGKKFFLIFFLLLLPPVAVADINLEISSNFTNTVLSPNEAAQMVTEINLGGNESGSNLLLIEVIYDSNKGWNYLNYSASLNNSNITFVVSENNINVSGISKHRITFSNQSLEQANITQPEKLTLKVNLSTPNNSSTYPVDAIAMWAFQNKSNIKSVTINATVSAATTLLVSAITPTSRVVQIGVPITLFMSIINSGTATASGVSISQNSSLPATVSYQQWNGTAFIGAPNTPVDIPVGSTAHFVLTINATAQFATSVMTFSISSTNAPTAPISRVNSLTLSTSAVPYADVIIMSTSLDVSTAVNTPAVFAVATTNVGGADANGASLILDIPSTITGLVTQVNQTNPATGAIIGPATGLTIPTGAQPTFAVFLTPTQPIAYDPANNRITLQLIDGSGKIIGAQSVAVSTT